MNWIFDQLNPQIQTFRLTHHKSRSNQKKVPFSVSTPLSAALNYAEIFNTLRSHPRSGTLITLERIVPFPSGIVLNRDTNWIINLRGF